jgi:hypothetical protein
MSMRTGVRMCGLGMHPGMRLKELKEEKRREDNESGEAIEWSRKGNWSQRERAEQERDFPRDRIIRNNAEVETSDQMLNHAKPSNGCSSSVCRLLTASIILFVSASCSLSASVIAACLLCSRRASFFDLLTSLLAFSSSF